MVEEQEFSLAGFRGQQQLAAGCLVNLVHSQSLPVQLCASGVAAAAPVDRSVEVGFSFDIAQCCGCLLQMVAIRGLGIAYRP